MDEVPKKSASPILLTKRGKPVAITADQRIRKAKGVQTLW